MKEEFLSGKDKNELVGMIADVAVMATERHIEVVELIKGQNVEIATMRADIDQVKANVTKLDAKVDQVKADISSVKAKMLASDLAAERRHEELLDAIRALRGIPGVVFAR